MTELTDQKACLALGYFDSVHLGHRALITVAREYAASNGLACAVATFSNNAYTQFNASEKQVYTYSERCDLLEGMCDLILPMRFDARMKSCPAERFLDILMAKHDIKAFVCGYDYLFGEGAEGDAEFLVAYGKAHGVETVVVPKFELAGERVSTTEIKNMLANGNIEKANGFLGEPFSISGKVVRGRGAGRMFDIPTANIKIASSKFTPKSGVYGSSIELDGKLYYGAANIGGRPTFGLTKAVVEMMIADFNENIYDKDVKIRLYKYLRPVTRFATPAELSRQVHKDIRWKDNA